MIQIKGDVKFSITLDSTTWIFDDRKVKTVFLKELNLLNLKITANGIGLF